MDQFYRFIASSALALLLILSSNLGFGQVNVTYGGLNSPELLAVDEAEYVAKVNNNLFFVSSGSRGVLSLISFDENNLLDPFSLVRKWEGSIDGNDIEIVNDVLYDNASSKLYLAQGNPGMLKVFDFDQLSNSLTFDDAVDLGSMNMPRRIEMTDEFILVTDLFDGRIADISYSNGLTLNAVHNFTSCGGIFGTYKDMAVSPDGNFVYVTVFDPPQVIKYSVEPSGLTCDGVTNMEDYLGTTLIGELEFISPYRAQVIACTGQAGVVEIDANGDFIDSIPNNLSGFDPMKCLFLSEDSIMVVQSANSTAHTMKLEADYSLTPIGNSESIYHYDNELIEMAGGAIIRAIALEGALGVSTVGLNGVYDDVVWTYQGGQDYLLDLVPTSLAISPSGQTLVMAEEGGRLAVFHPDNHGRPVLSDLLDAPFGNVFYELEFIDESRLLGFTGFGTVSGVVELDLQMGTAEMNGTAYPIPGYESEVHYSEASQHAVLVPPTSGPIRFFPINGIDMNVPIEFSLADSTAYQIRSDISPLGDRLVVTVGTCDGSILIFDWDGQDWTLTSSLPLTDISCPVTDVAFLGSAERVGVLGGSELSVLNVGTWLSQEAEYILHPENSGLQGKSITFDSVRGLISVASLNEFNTESDDGKWTFLTYTFGQIAELDTFRNQTGQVQNLIFEGTQRFTDNGNYLYTIGNDEQVIQTFGISGSSGVRIPYSVQILFSIYPNPTNSNLTISFEENFSGTLTILDNMGRRVLSESVNAASLVVDLQGQPTGLYHVRTLSNDGELNTMSVLKN